MRFDLLKGLFPSHPHIPLILPQKGQSAGHRDGLLCKPYRHYVCGNKLRLGSTSCEGKRVATKILDTHVLQIVLGRILTPKYLDALLEEVNAELTKGLVGVEEEIQETQRQITRLDRAIEALLDLAETEGSAAVAGRLKKREEEKASLEATLHRLQARRERGSVTVSEEVFADAIQRLRDNLQEGTTLARRRVLKSFVQKIEVGKRKGNALLHVPSLRVIS